MLLQNFEYCCLLCLYRRWMLLIMCYRSRENGGINVKLVMISNRIMNKVMYLTVDESISGID